VSIHQSFATGNVTASGDRCVGGLGGEADEDVDVVDSYAGGMTTTSAGQLAGLFGCARNRSIRTSYSTGLVHNAAHAQHAGYIGTASVNEIVADYWDIDTSGQSKACVRGNCSGVTGLTDAQLKSGLPAGFDPKIWGQSASINNGYPYLIANSPQ
jgi:hypothetical protein